MNHTPTPVEVHDNGTGVFYLFDTHGKNRATFNPTLDGIQNEKRLKEDAEFRYFVETACNAHEELVKALKLHQRFWDEMPKGQLGKLVCDIGILNDAFLSTSKALAKAGVKP